MVSTYIVVMPFKKLKLSSLGGDLAEAPVALVNLKKKNKGTYAGHRIRPLRHLNSCTSNTSKRVTA